MNLIALKLAPDNRVRNIILLVFSLVFYAWGEPRYVLLLLTMSLASWFFALQIDKSESSHGLRVLFMALECVVCLGLLGVFKYGTFFLTQVHLITGNTDPVIQIALPIGISFYTFQLLSYVIDVYRGEVKAQPRFMIVLLYASLFHQCIAGPIVRYSDVERELIDRTYKQSDLNQGVMRFAFGLAKKVLLANNCGMFVDQLLVADGASDAAAALGSRSVLALWVGMLFYALQIYLDFSAYSDMAIGMGLMSGFHYKENFNYPYTAASVTDFWRRWHISLGSFFRDYVYIPLGGNRKGAARQIFNLFVVWALTGFWHGASWNFVLWGLYWFVFLVFEKFFLLEKLKKLPAFVSHIYLLFVVYFGWVLFKFDDLKLVGTTFKGMFGLNRNPFATTETATYISGILLFLLLAIFACTPIVKNLGRFFVKRAEFSDVETIAVSVGRIAIPTILLLISAISLVGETYNPFLYFRF